MSLETRLQSVVAAVFPVDAAALTDSDSPATIPQWDSVGHLDLMLAIEAEFAVQLSPDEMAALTNVGAIREYLARTIHG